MSQTRSNNMGSWAGMKDLNHGRRATLSDAAPSYSKMNRWLDEKPAQGAWSTVSRMSSTTRVYTKKEARL